MEARQEHVGFDEWQKVLGADGQQQRKLFEKYGLIDDSMPRFWPTNETATPPPTVAQELAKQQMLLLSNGLNDKENRLKEKYYDLAKNAEAHERGLPDDVEDKWMAEWRKTGLFDKMPLNLKINEKTLETVLLQVSNMS